ncbi:xylose isomerase domain protein TIM barrel [Candidatus Vecturithrix granuli]|uniref:Xylose isomerase domain protein TIM barrel n=1 Tax=Vecturithrix granuli TaxID=1499967 RepID=A0A081CAH1_VECG1|nr:xylose isomerase domain protein TIM barrel [Candidatus Vecturithrix granuli]
MYSMTSDYVKSIDSPQPYLRKIADAGFTHIHWCHHWDTDFLYGDSEIVQIKKWLDEYGLKLNDLHATAGKEKYWVSSLEYERQAGVDLVKNRIEMAARLETDVIIMHPSNTPDESDSREKHGDRLLRSLDELQPFAKSHGVRFALENVMNTPFLVNLGLDNYSPDYIGICYDSGHGNFLKGSGLDWLEPRKERLISLHLHDNDGTSDQHKIPFTGRVDWDRLTRIIAESPYNKAVNLECAIHKTGFTIEMEFLVQALEAAKKIEAMIETVKSGTAA